ncbi:MAG TPA: putative lipid II flippase FtsW [Candidatus Brocadiia bacterium]|nr:putative lipid II flippase FtsW [Candidatus Brocadiia bacterium]
MILGDTFDAQSGTPVQHSVKADEDGRLGDGSGANEVISGRQGRLLCVVLTLVGIGVLMVYSASLGNVATPEEGRGILAKQLMFVALGIIGMIFGMTVPIAAARRHSLLIMGLSVAALLAVYVPGFGLVLNGARRWVRLPGGITFQPSEFTKLAIIIFAAAYSERFKDRMKSLWWGFTVPMGIIGFVCLFVLMEPDFGTCVLTMSVGTLVLLAGGMRLSPLIVGGIMALPAFEILVMNVPYRRARVLSFIDPWADSRGAGYQICQSLMAMGRGGIFGTGVGGSVQKLGFLPEANSDFVLAIVGEELGFVGCLLVLFLFGVLLWEGLNVALGSEDYFTFLLAYGVSVLITLQAIINVAVTTGSVPPKGLPLPFISAGGSSLVFTMFAGGVLMHLAGRNAGKRTPLLPFAVQEPRYQRAFYELIEDARDGGSAWLSARLHLNNEGRNRPGAAGGPRAYEPRAGSASETSVLQKIAPVARRSVGLGLQTVTRCCAGIKKGGSK